MQALVDGRDASAPEDSDLSDPSLMPQTLPYLLPKLGRALIGAQTRRGGFSSNIPEQEVTANEGVYCLRFRAGLPVEEWNAQVSLLIGMCAAQIMLKAGVGILRTVPPASAADVERLRAIARELDLHWPHGQSMPSFLAGLDPADPPSAALLTQSRSLLRGSGYVTLGTPQAEGGPSDPNAASARDLLHGAIAAHYAHVTAPLRRLVDRFGSEVCIAACADRPVPQWVVDALPDLPGLMDTAGSLASSVDHAVIGAIEALVLRPHVGQRFCGIVVDIYGNGNPLQGDAGRLMTRQPAVLATIKSATPHSLHLGTSVVATLTRADTEKWTVDFALDTTHPNRPNTEDDH